MSSLVMIDHAIKGDDTTRELKVTGIDDTYDRYLAIGRGLTTSYNNSLSVRVTKSGTTLTTNEYCRTGYRLRSDITTLGNDSNSAGSTFRIMNNNSGNNLYNTSTGLIYIYLTNFADASGYDYMMAHGVSESNAQNGYVNPLTSCVVKNASASDGIVLYQASNEIRMGELTLYGMV